ncbi:AI-2E family transporter [bacterium]|nr:AI-2E family transporter [bacterium]
MLHMSDMLPRHQLATVHQLAKECDDVLGAFLRGQLLIMFSLGLLYMLGLWLLGLDLAFLLGLIAGLASVVPYLGFVVGVLVSSIAAMVQFGDWIYVLGVLAVFGVGQLVESLFLTPVLVGDKIGLHPVAVIFAVLAGGQLFGFAGVLLALPVAAVLVVLLRHAHHGYKQSVFYGADTAEEQVADVPDDTEPEAHDAV